MAESSAAAARVAGIRGTVNIRVSENVTLENLNNIIAHIVGISGCRTCGLIGIDVRLSGDPAEMQQVTKLPGVVSASFNAE
jgi:hypothetical protein